MQTTKTSSRRPPPCSKVPASSTSSMRIAGASPACSIRGGTSLRSERPTTCWTRRTVSSSPLYCSCRSLSSSTDGQTQRNQTMICRRKTTNLLAGMIRSWTWQSLCSCQSMRLPRIRRRILVGCWILLSSLIEKILKRGPTLMISKTLCLQTPVSAPLTFIKT